MFFMAQKEPINSKKIDSWSAEKLANELSFYVLSNHDSIKHLRNETADLKKRYAKIQKNADKIFSDLKEAERLMSY